MRSQALIPSMEVTVARGSNSVISCKMRAMHSLPTDRAEGATEMEPWRAQHPQSAAETLSWPPNDEQRLLPRCPSLRRPVFAEERRGMAARSECRSSHEQGRNRSGSLFHPRPTQKRGEDVHKWCPVRYHHRCWTSSHRRHWSRISNCSAKCASGVVTRTRRLHERNVEGVFGRPRNPAIIVRTSLPDGTFLVVWAIASLW